jgi:uncharacterized protein YecE (DUF72 family)
MTTYHAGTAGWSYEDWEGIVYPPRKPRGFHPLPFLAGLLDMVEVNSTFYRPPSAHLTLAWLQKVQAFPRFLFAVKLHQVFTHNRNAFGQKDVDEFRAGIDPLRLRERLAAVLLQFPWSYLNTDENRDHLARLFALFAEYPLALEVRHASWDTPEFRRFLEDNKVAFCNIDQPVFKNCLRPSAVSTTPAFAYVRLHGRNYKNWFRAGAGRDDRYDYLYEKDELQEWIDRIKQLGQKSGKIYVITNNHYRGQAMANALQIKNMLSGEKLEIPRLLIERYPALEEILKRIRKGQKDLFGDEES